MTETVLETVFFNRPPEWGWRIVQRGNEIVLQNTNDKGKTWTDDTPGLLAEFRLIIGEDGTRTLQPRVEVQTRTLLRSGEVEQAETQEIKSYSPEAWQAINANTFFSKKGETSTKAMRTLSASGTIETSNAGQEIEQITLLGGLASAQGLRAGEIWRDSENYLRIVPG